MRAAGLAESVAKGQWRILPADPGSSDAPLPAQATEAIQPDPVVAEAPAPRADREVGSGRDSVYVYYLPTYRELAQIRGSTRFHCKIGMSTRDPLLRVASQAGTALPEHPRIALNIRTDRASELEKAIHGILKVRGQYVSDAPGNEWFLTSPDEVMEIFEWVSSRPPDADELSDYEEEEDSTGGHTID